MFITTNPKNIITFYSNDISELPPEEPPGLYRLSDNYFLSTFAATNTYSVDKLPEDIDSKVYAYTPDNGFYEYTEGNKYDIPDELLVQIKDDTIQEVQNELNS